ncbi:MAG: hypothetical protein HC924_05180 [Synechococcaceae cyanobacterium SM2_3_2]|nr:hypothetical protein [Synechococcaceae cyanobacterium SM2_3_2]
MPRCFNSLRCVIGIRSEESWLAWCDEVITMLIPPDSDQ